MSIFAEYGAFKIDPFNGYKRYKSSFDTNGLFSGRMGLIGLFIRHVWNIYVWGTDEV